MENRHCDSARWGGHNLFSNFKADRYLHVYTHIINAHSSLLTLMSIFFFLSSFFFLFINVSNPPRITYIFHYIWCSILLFTWLDLIIINIIIVICERNAVLPHFTYLYQFHPYLNFLVSRFHLSRSVSHYFKFFFQHFVHWFSQSALLVDGSHLKYTVSSWHESLFRILYTQKCLSSEFASIL